MAFANKNLNLISGANRVWMGVALMVLLAACGGGGDGGGSQVVSSAGCGPSLGLAVETSYQEGEAGVGGDGEGGDAGADERVCCDG